MLRSRALRAVFFHGVAAGWLFACSLGASAGVLRYCDAQGKLDVARQNQMLQFSEQVKAEIEKSGVDVALVSSSGLDLKSLGVRYSHTGVSLKHNTAAPWAVRQLYYDCDKKKPRIFDQGMAGFVMGAADASVSYVSIVYLPPNDALGTVLERTALDNAHAVGLLGADYSANAYPFSTLYQNCNQWVMELLAAAWGDLAVTPTMRAEAQGWLKQENYAPKTFTVHFRPLLWAARLVPWLHREDHPEDNVDQGIFQTSMPSEVEAFVRQEAAAAQRIELCKNDKFMVVRHGWTPLPEGCTAEAGDEVIALQE